MYLKILKLPTCILCRYIVFIVQLCCHIVLGMKSYLTLCNQMVCIKFPYIFYTSNYNLNREPNDRLLILIMVPKRKNSVRRSTCLTYQANHVHMLHNDI